MMSYATYRILSAALMAVAVSFVIINLGLRLLPEGQAFLAAARARGHMLANPTVGAARPVRIVFAAAVVLALLSGGATWALLERGPEPLPVHTPSPAPVMRG